MRRKGPRPAAALQWFARLVLPPDEAGREALKQALVRILIATNLLLGFFYVAWRYAASINWRAWPIALALLAAETYSYGGAWLFGLTMWRLRRRPAPPPPPAGATVDVFITCYNEPVELVRLTVQGARRIRYPHRTFILDDGANAAMRAMATEEGVGYVVRSDDWRGKPRHAKAGNLNNALLQTDGEFILILDADQRPLPQILDRTLGFFRDPKVALVQTRQTFYNLPPGDPFGSGAALFYGPIQQGKDGWNAAFFCGSNAVLRREALMQLGIAQYVRELDARVRRALAAADRVLRRAERELAPGERTRMQTALRELKAAVWTARIALRAGEPIQLVTWEFQRRARAVSRLLVSEDLAAIRAELAGVPGLEAADLEGSLAAMLDDPAALGRLADREASPLAAVGAVRSLLLAVDVDRGDEAQPVMPLATISVTEDMATAMRLHGLGWRTVYHDEDLALGLAPDELRAALQQRLRWAQGTIQVMLKESPLRVPGLSLGQRLMYFSTMWSYLSGFASVVYLVAPTLYLLFGVSPVRAYSSDFFWHLIPYLVVNQLLFTVIGWGRPTWRGQQYSLALFPLWIQAVTTAVGNVYFGRKLGFVVTPKVREGGVHLRLVRVQLAAMALLVFDALFALGRLALGLTGDAMPIIVNVLWVCYDLVCLSAVLDAAVYRPDPAREPIFPAVEADGRSAVGAAG